MIEIAPGSENTQAVTFDCAQTIVDVRWTLDGFISETMARIGSPITKEEADLYQAMYVQGLPEYLHLNQTRSEAECDAWWNRLGVAWLEATGRPGDLIDPLVEEGNRVVYGEGSQVFRPYEDVIPCFEALAARGIRTAVVSNWDFSLHRVLRMFGYDQHLEFALASLEEGVEKPDPRLFEIATERLGLDPDSVVHVGDRLDDDVEGAYAAGMRAVLIDRTGQTPGAITSLHQLPEALGWTA